MSLFSFFVYLTTSVYVLDGGGPKDSKNTLNSFLTTNKEKVFWQIGAAMFFMVPYVKTGSRGGWLVSKYILDTQVFHSQKQSQIEWSHNLLSGKATFNGPSEPTLRGQLNPLALDRVHKESSVESRMDNPNNQRTLVKLLMPQAE